MQLLFQVCALSVRAASSHPITGESALLGLSLNATSPKITLMLDYGSRSRDDAINGARSQA